MQFPVKSLWWKVGQRVFNVDTLSTVFEDEKGNIEIWRANTTSPRSIHVPGSDGFEEAQELLNFLESIAFNTQENHELLT